MDKMTNLTERFQEKLEEPRSVIWVYDYSKNRTRRMRKETLISTFRNPDDFYQVSIPMKPGRISVQAEDDDFGGPKTVALRVHISMYLRLQRWLGLQKRVYVVDNGIVWSVGTRLYVVFKLTSPEE